MGVVRKDKSVDAGLTSVHLRCIVWATNTGKWKSKRFAEPSEKCRLVQGMVRDR